LRIGLPVWNGRLSPLFDTARSLMVAEIRGGNVVGSKTEIIGETIWSFRVRRLSELGIKVLICGGISRGLAVMVTAAGIRVVAGVVGNTDELLEAYVDGRLDAPQYCMPGWRRGRRRRFRRGC
jgi:predicted Fe-Mo cluster-binding NifX family protein